MAKEVEAPVITVQENKKGPSPAVWAPLLLVVIFPMSVLAAIPLVVAARRGMARLNLIYLSVGLAIATGLLYFSAKEPISAYLNTGKTLIAKTGLITVESTDITNIPLFVTAGLTIGSLLATIYAFAWRAKHKNEEWMLAHPESIDVVSRMFVNRRNARIAQENEAVIEKIREGEWFGPEAVGLGYTLESVQPGHKIQPVGLPDLVGGSVNHSLILGSSGRGKTQTITRQAFDAIKNGCPVLVVDAKGDGDLASKLGAFAEEFGRPFYHFSIPTSTSAPYVGPSENGRAFYDPAGLSAGNHTRRRDFMMNARDWTGAPAVYSDKTRDWLSRALWVDNVVAECNGGRPLETVPQATFTRIADFMSPITTKHYLKEAGARFGVDAVNAALGTTTFDLMVAEIEEYATMKDQTGESARMSHAAWLRTFMSSVTGPYLRDTGDSRTVDIARIVEEQAVCVFDLATDQYREEAPALARLVVADLLTYISDAGKADGIRLRVFLDEFAAVGGEESANVLARARSAGVSFTLSTQTLSDLRDVSEAFEGQVLTNSLNLLIHNASTWDEAERLAGMTGQIDSERITRSSHNNGVEGAGTKSVTTERRYRIEASEFMEMGVGELVKISQVERGADKAVKIAVVMPPSVQAPVYTVDTALLVHPVEPEENETVSAPVEVTADSVDAHEILEDLADVPESTFVTPASFEETMAHVDTVEPHVEPKEVTGSIADSVSISESLDAAASVKFVGESESERKARIADLAASGPLFEPDALAAAEEVALDSVAPVSETAPEESEPVRPVRPVRTVRHRSSE